MAQVALYTWKEGLYVELTCIRSYTTMKKFLAKIDDEMFAYCIKSCIVNVSIFAQQGTKCVHVGTHSG